MLHSKQPGLARPLGALVTVAMAAWLAGLPLQASAMLGENIAISTIAMSLGNAVTADPPGLDSIHFNPAGLARMKGKWKSENFVAVTVTPRASFTKPAGFSVGGFTDDPVAGTSTGPVRATLYVPGIGANAKLPLLVGGTPAFSYNQPDSPITFGSAPYFSQGVMLDRTQDPNDPARFSGKTVVLQRLVYASPTIGYKVSDTFSVGFGVPIAHQAMKIDLDMRTPNKLLGLTGKLQDAWCGNNGNPLDAFGFGLCGGGLEGRMRPFNRAANLSIDGTNPMDPTINVGVLWEPKDWFALGAVYQGGSDTKINGRFKMHTDPMLRKFVEGMYSSLLGPIAAAMVGMPASIREDQTGNFSTTLPFVQRVQFGLKIKPIKRLQFNLDASWDEGAKLDKIKLQFDQEIDTLKALRMFGEEDPTSVTVKMGAQSKWSWGMGMQFNVTDRLTLRAGYEDRKSSIPKNQFSLTAPLPDMIGRSLGVGYVTKKGTQLDFTASYLYGKISVPADGSCNMNCSNFFNVVYNPYAGLDVDADMTIKYIGFRLAHPI